MRDSRHSGASNNPHYSGQADIRLSQSQRRNHQRYGRQETQHRAMGRFMGRRQKQQGGHQAKSKGQSQSRASPGGH